MWLLPTRGRPEMCQRVMIACQRTNMTTPGVVLVDSRVDSYPHLRALANWQIVRLPLDMADAMEWCLHQFPNAPFYGWMSDDLVPRTMYWDVELKKAAGDWFMAHCNDAHLALDPVICLGVLSGAMCWGGELVRTVGWWALPGVKQGGIDDAWVHMFARLFNLKRYRSDVIVEHITYLNSKRPRDETDVRVRAGIAYIDKDLQTYHEWRHSQEPQIIVDRVKARMRSAGYDLSADQFIARLT